ncbi:hypothetical protein ABZ297_19365 [Nonomuraea sp. NPDC005983]
MPTPAGREEPTPPAQAAPGPVSASPSRAGRDVLNSIAERALGLPCAP